ncbi:Dynein assembly factor 5, axonemal [Nymphon striatum]|nr:Dynein assembly factor 5, axonemal [Nymphon striatum]
MTMEMFDQEMRVLCDQKTVLWKQALTNIFQKTKTADVNDNRELFSNLIKLLPKVLANGNESCRELILNLLKELIDSTKLIDSFLPQIVETIKYKLEKSNEDTVEKSEEIRLIMIEILRKMVDNCNEVGISCKIYKCDVIEFGDNTSVVDVSPHLAQRLFDDSVQVRLSVVQITGRWLLILRDRSSLFIYILPIILSCLNDEISEIRQEARKVWDEAGKLYENENEFELKEQLYTQFSNYPENVIRPRLGSRILIQQNFSKIIKAVINDLKDWIIETRIKSAILLWTLILHEEDQIAQHLNQILPAIYKASSDREQEVVNWVGKCGKLIGCFIKPSIWKPLVFAQIENSVHGQSLFNLSNIAEGANHLELEGHIDEISLIIFKDDIMYTYENQLQSQLIYCLEVFSKNVINKAVQHRIFFAAISASSLVPHLQNQADEVLINLSKVGNLESTDSLYRLHMPNSIDKLMKNYDKWMITSYEVVIINSLIRRSGKVVGEHLDKIVPLFQVILKSSLNLEIRVKFFILLSNLLLDCSKTVDSIGKFKNYILTITEGILIPTLVWQPGQKASALRLASISCLWSLLKGFSFQSSEIKLHFEQLLHSVIMLLEDDNTRTKIIAHKIMDILLMNLQSHFDRGLHPLTLYPVLMKSLDDSADSVRLEAISTFAAYFDCFSFELDKKMYANHFAIIYKGLLIHLDDTNKSIQSSVLELLKSCSKFWPQMLVKEVEDAQTKHQSDSCCKELLSYIKSL